MTTHGTPPTYIYCNDPDCYGECSSAFNRPREVLIPKSDLGAVSVDLDALRAEVGRLKHALQWALYRVHANDRDLSRPDKPEEFATAYVAAQELLR